MENSPATRPITFDSNGTRVEHEHVTVRRIGFALSVTSCYSHPLLPVGIVIVFRQADRPVDKLI